MEIKEALETLKEHCKSIDDCLKCEFYFSEDHYELSCYFDDKYPSEYDTDIIKTINEVGGNMYDLYL